MPRNHYSKASRFVNDMDDGRGANAGRRRGDYHGTDGPVGREAASIHHTHAAGGGTKELLGPESPDAKSDKRMFHPQKTPFSSASREADRAVTPENYHRGRQRGYQP